MKRVYFLLFFVAISFVGLSLVASAPLHKFYMSIFEFNYDSEKRAVEVTGRIFTDDLEAALEQAGAGKVTITEEKNETINKHIGTYLSKKVAFKVDGKNVELSFLGIEVEEDITWVYLEATEVAGFSKIWIQNTVLSEVQEKQTNIIYLFKGTEELSLLLKDGEWEGELEF